MWYASHIGRIGALAVALGIGAALATTPWAATAKPSDSGSSTASSSSADTAAYRKVAGASSSGKGAVSNSSASTPSTAGGSTKTATESPIGHGTSAAEASQPAKRSAEPGAVVDADAGRTAVTTSQDADTTAPEKRGSASSSKAATPAAGAPGAPEVSEADAPATHRVKRSKASAENVTLQPTSSAKGPAKAPGNDTSALLPVSAPAPEPVRPSKIGAAEVVSGSVVQRSAEPVSEAPAVSIFAAAPSWTDTERNAVVTTHAASAPPP